MANDNNPTLKRKAAAGLAWNITDRLFSRGLQFVFSVIIARRLLPDDYGIIAIINFFLGIAQSLIDSGFGGALMKKEDRNETDFNTVFYFNITVSIILYAVLWFVAPLLGDYYNQPLLVPTTRVVMLSLLMNALCFTQNVQMQLSLKFNIQTWISLASNTASGIIGIILAYSGFGIWALAIQTTSALFIRSILLLIIIRWKPRLCFSFKSLRQLFSFGSSLMIADYLEQLYNGFYTLTIGKSLSTSALGVYGKATAFADTPSTLIAGPLRTVFYPVFCNIQDQPEVRINYFRKMFALVAYISFPVMIGMAAVADPLVRILLTDNWSPMIVPFQILCIAFSFPPIASLCRTLILSYGDSRSNLLIQLICKAFGILLLITLISKGVNSICIGIVCSSILMCILYVTRSLRFVRLKWKHILFDMLIPFVFSAVMFIAVSAVMTLIANLYLKLAIGVLIGVLVYFLLSTVIKPNGWKVLIESVKSI